MKQSCFPPYRGFAALDMNALVRNFCLLREKAQETGGDTRVIAVVKANAYGHGMAQVLPALARAGCDFFAVATPDEALEARRLCKDADVLVLGYTPPACAVALAEAHITQTVFSADYAAALSSVMRAAKTRLNVHLKIDGGMCRLGFAPSDTEGLLQVLHRRELLVTGLYTHFPCADSDPLSTRQALAAFCACRDRLKALGYPLFSHAAASAAALTLPEARLDAVRAGIALYGYPPVQAAQGLLPAMRLIAPVVQLHRAAAGTPVGYGGHFVCKRESVIGTVPLGYADGMLRTLTGHRLTVLCEDRTLTAPIVGRICMDYLMLDLTDLPAKEGETVCVFEDFSAMACHAQTIPYELLTAVSARVPRCEKGEV
jgi:alanine racemase